MWITSSGVTLYLAVIGIQLEGARTRAQLHLNNYSMHLQRGRDFANRNLSTFCVGPTRRQLQVSASEQSAFCALNATALHAFTMAAARFQSADTVTRESDLQSIPTTVTSSSGGQDAVVADVLWRMVRDELEFQNASVDHVRQWHEQVSALQPFGGARLLWFYVYAVILGLRLSKPMLSFRIKKSVGKIPV